MVATVEKKRPFSATAANQQHTTLTANYIPVTAATAAAARAAAATRAAAAIAEGGSKLQEWANSRSCQMFTRSFGRSKQVPIECIQQQQQQQQQQEQQQQYQQQLT
ncbi:hypothetical protein Emed_006735 [Eimeria media]